MALIKYAVIQGHETEVGAGACRHGGAQRDGIQRSRGCARPQVHTYVQGQQVDVWTDEQLKSGGVGFLNERAERARVKSVSISYLGGGKN